MILRRFLLFAFIIGCSFQTTSKTNAFQTGKASSTPMSCKIEGEIVSEMKMQDKDTGSICSKYPCKAKVRILKVLDRGSSVSISINAGDTIEVNFAYSLSSTSTISPAMKAQYPGLKRKDRFIADVTEHLQIAANPLFTVYGYEVISAK